MSYLQLIAKVRIFLETTKLFGNYFSKSFLEGKLTHLLSYSLLTSVLKKLLNYRTLLLYNIYYIIIKLLVN